MGTSLDHNHHPSDAPYGECVGRESPLKKIKLSFGTEPPSPTLAPPQPPSLLLRDEYAPRKVTDLVGNTSEVKTLDTWMGTWAAGGRARAKGEKRNVHFPGPPGSGKTTVAHQMATQRGYAALELNASDVRSSKQVKRELGDATATQGIDLGSGLVKRRPHCVIMDEVDGMHNAGTRVEWLRRLRSSRTRRPRSFVPATTCKRRR
jgi:hypothetical protein